MADFTTVMTDTAALDDSLVQEFESQFLVANAQEQVMEAYVSYRRDIGAKAIEIPRYDQLALATSALTEKEDPASEALVDSKVTVQPLEYGNVVTTTKLANLQTGGKADLAAARLVGINAGRTQDKLALLALDASSNVLFGNGAASEGALVATDVLTSSDMNKVYNKLSRESVPGLPQAAGDYIAVMHDDVLFDIRDGSGAGSWIDVHKYALPGEVLKNEVGMYRGFRVIRDNHATINVDGGAATVDSYTSYFLGFNALGKAVGQDVQMRMTGPFDKLGRFLNLGWLGCFKYQIIESQACYLVKSASSVGAN